jgi:hypothetical protein
MELDPDNEGDVLPDEVLFEAMQEKVTSSSKTMRQGQKKADRCSGGGGVYVDDGSMPECAERQNNPASPPPLQVREIRALRAAPQAKRPPRANAKVSNGSKCCTPPKREAPATAPKRRSARIAALHCGRDRPTYSK